MLATSKKEYAAMVASPHPTELLKPLDPDRMVRSDRNLSCVHYLRCLDEAVTQEWVSWTCANCMILTMPSGAVRSMESNPESLRTEASALVAEGEAGAGGSETGRRGRWQPYGAGDGKRAATCHTRGR